MSTPILPFAVWASGTNQNSLPANDNSLRHQILNGLVISDVVTAQPGSPADGDIYILAGTHTGSQWAGFSEDDLVIFMDGTWYAFAPSDGVVVNFADEQKQWLGGSNGWVTLSGGSSGGSTQGKHAIAIMAGGMRPSVTGGCAAVVAIASAANQPDIVSLDFDPTTEEYAQFAIPMPKKWNASTITARFRWSHASTTTNFGVVWSLQALAISDDDAIAQAFGTAQTVADTGGTTNDLYITSETSAITIAGSPAKGDTVFFRVARVTANGSDTMAIDARLHGVDVFITTDADTDA